MGEHKHGPSCGHDHRPQVHAAWPAPADVAAVVLAAGRASRMGQPKAVLPLAAPWGAPAGEPAVHRIARVCREAGVGRVIVVLGHHAAEVRAAVGGLADLAMNAAPERGMFSSVRVGLEVSLSVPTPPEGVLIWPVDCPLLRVEALRAFFAAGMPWLRKEGLCWARLPVSARRPDQPGHPVLLSQALARRALALGDDARLDALIADKEVVAHRVVVDDPHVAINLNTIVDARPFILGDAR